MALVVNSAYLHHSAIENVMSLGYNVISEKPLTYSKYDTAQLLAAATKQRLKIFSTNTYLFADYMHIFRREWLEGDPLSAITLTWSDAQNESRYGENKKYDSSVPVIYDVLPHVANIILATYGSVEIVRSNIEVTRGGSEVEIQYECQNTTLHVSISRNAPHRVRHASFSNNSSLVALDFSTEPGLVLRERKKPIVVDPLWEAKQKPIAAMLSKVMQYFDNGVLDERLNNEAALLSNDMIDSVDHSYVQQQVDFLSQKQNLISASNMADFAYAEKEINSISQRALPTLPEKSPLRRLKV